MSNFIEPEGVDKDIMIKKKMMVLPKAFLLGIGREI